MPQGNLVLAQLFLGLLAISTPFTLIHAAYIASHVSTILEPGDWVKNFAGRALTLLLVEGFGIYIFLLVLGTPVGYSEILGAQFASVGWLINTLKEGIKT